MIYFNLLINLIYLLFIINLKISHNFMIHFNLLINLFIYYLLLI